LLSPLQQRVAGVIAGLPEAEDFALAGGAALIVHGAIDRSTRDLDFFGLEPDAVDRLAPAAERALEEDGLSVERVLDRPGFVRFLVVGQDGRTEVDLGSDARLFPVDQGPGFKLLAPEELAVDKVLAVFGRAEARDFMDLMAIEDQFGLDRLFRAAADKDRGFDLKVFADMNDRFDRFVETSSRSTTSSTDGSPGSSHVGVPMLANSAGSRVDFTTQVLIVATTSGSDTEFRQAVRAFRIGEPCGTQ
jgi:hypothetical protein